jgi:hydrogenase maturation protein HypF
VIQRAHIVCHGAVQGVGFRPFVYRLATELNLRGWVLNSSAGVFIEVQGERDLLETFLLRLQSEKPARAFIQSLEFSYLDPVEFAGFEIRPSSSAGDRNTLVLPDIAPCPDCLADILDPENRRHRYPFTNCTNCGPRFTIIEALPYDRGNTSMKQFAMCAECRREYEDPLDRRFHAQPTACPTCGPRLELWDPSGRVLAAADRALQDAAEAVRLGKIVALKGLGGFHLIVDARSHEAVSRLRARKRREQKPLALLYADTAGIRRDCTVSRLEERLLASPEAPIVLLARNPQSGSIAAAVAPGNPYLGAMLPSTPLHFLFMRELDFPVVATSGNLSDEPICTDEHEALQRLGGIADVFLVHNRPIVRHVDDSIVRIMLDRELVLRRARGYAPLPLRLHHDAPPMLAVGAHLKNTIALSVRQNVFISQHIGDLETSEAYAAFCNVIDSFNKLFEVKPEVLVMDLHPDYLSTRYARASAGNLVTVQHHWAHVAACMAENELEDPVLGVSWDGTGYGLDGTIWGGEFLLAEHSTFRRVASLRTFRLPGGEKAIKEPRRSALGLLHEIYGDTMFERDHPAILGTFGAAEIRTLRKMLAKGLNSPLTSSAGRIFDAVSALLGMRLETGYEGQAAMELEFAATGDIAEDCYPFALGACPEAAVPELIRVNWGPAILALLSDLHNGQSRAAIAGRFHRTLAEMIVSVALKLEVERIALSGGCFQNKYLTERTIRRLMAEGFKPYWHQRIPPNDGGIAVGQIVAALRSRQRSE